MTRLAHNVEAEFAATEIKTSLTGRKCWYGYTVGSSFQIALGRRIARDPAEIDLKEKLRARRASRGIKPKTEGLSRQYDRFTGESNLLVWCSWRLEGESGPITSSDDEPAHCEQGVRRLIDHTVRAVTIAGGWDLQVEFNGGLVLSVFPDHVGAAASFDGNWEVWQPTQAYLIGTDLTCTVMDRENRAMQLRPRQGRWEVRGPEVCK